MMGMSGEAKSAPSQGPSARALPAGTAVHFAIADFDGDEKPDLATVQTGGGFAYESRYRIYLQLSSGSQQSFGVTAPMGGLQLVPRDVNDDQSLDLVVSTTWLGQPVAVLLNDGHGNFTLADPGAFPKVMRGPSTELSRTAVQVEDNAVVSPSKSSAKADVEGARILPAGEDGGFAALPVSSMALIQPEFGCSGRAPPCGVLHV